MDLMQGKGIELFDLGRGMFCGECGRAKAWRAMGILTGCPECDEVTTRHRCLGRPDRADLALGDSWKCPDCGSVWTAAETPADCGECGRPDGTIPSWDTAEGPYLATAPRWTPPPASPWGRLAAACVPRTMTPRPLYQHPGGGCYALPSGSWVHVRPGCRCPR